MTGHCSSRLTLFAVLGALLGACSSGGHHADAGVFGDGSVGDASRDGHTEAPHEGLYVAVSPLTLVPAFASDIHDYYVQCKEGDNPLTVTMTAAPGSTIGLEAPVVTRPATSGTSKLTLQEGDLVRIAAGGDAASETYWIRCLPHGFPPMVMALHPEAGAPSPGYYLFGSTIEETGVIGYAMVLDVHGVPLWYHTPEKPDAGALVVDNLLPGTISYLSQPIGNYTLSTYLNRFELHDLLTGTKSYVTSVGVGLDPHELRRMDNGDYLVFASPLLTHVDLTGLGTFGSDETMAECEIQEIDPSGKLVWSWKATDHFSAPKDSTWPEVAKSQGLMVGDVFHCNSIDVASNGDLIVSARQMDTVFRIDRSAGPNNGKVLWKMGGQSYSVDGAPFITVKGDMYTSFYGQHDARILPNGDITMYDDHTVGSGRLYPMTPGPARGLVLSLDMSSLTATIVRQYAQPLPVRSMGSFRVDDAGAAVICWGQTYGTAFTEIDKDNHPLLDFTCPDHTNSYRVVKVPMTAFDIDLLRSTAGKN